MGIFNSLFNIILYKPLFNLLVILYYYLPIRDLGISIIILTLIVKFFLYPITLKSLISQKKMTELQPKIKEIQKKYKNKKEEQAKALMELYKKEKINPFSGCLPLLIQFPILIALLKVFWGGITPEAMVDLYSFIPYSGEISSLFLGILDLSKPNIFLALIAGTLQYIQTKQSSQQKNSFSEEKDFSYLFQKQMLYFFPFFTFLILLKIPAAIALYWIISLIFGIFQYLILNKTTK